MSNKRASDNLYRKGGQLNRQTMAQNLLGKRKLNILDEQVENGEKTHFDISLQLTSSISVEIMNQDQLFQKYFLDSVSHFVQKGGEQTFGNTFLNCVKLQRKVVDEFASSDRRG